MQVKTIASTPARGSAEFAQLRELVTGKAEMTEVAIALAASDLPQQHYVTFEDAVMYAVQGMCRIGVEAVRERAQDLRRVIIADIQLTDAGVLSTDRRRRELTRRSTVLRGASQRRFTWCNDVAYRLHLNGNAVAARRGDPEWTPAPQGTSASPSLRSRLGSTVSVSTRSGLAVAA